MSNVHRDGSLFLPLRRSRSSGSNDSFPLLDSPGDQSVVISVWPGSHLGGTTMAHRICRVDVDL